MPDLSTILLFAVATTALLLIPGPVVIYTVTRSIEQGRRAGLVSALAASVGDFCQVVAATLGLSTILLSSALAFTVVKYAGAAYLIYLGIQTLRTPKLSSDTTVPKPQPLSRIFSQGVVVSVLNPKTALFFLAFLPQFVRPDRGSIPLQIFVLGILFVCMGMIANCVYALIASSISTWLKRSRAYLWAQRYVAGSVYIALGIATAVTGSENGK
jgi:threonine/homoserine/homoserine lactone efflux protein